MLTFFSVLAPSLLRPLKRSSDMLIRTVKMITELVW